MRSLVLRSTNRRNAAIRRQNQNGRHLRLQHAIQERVALHIQHVRLVDEQHARHDRCLPVLLPLRHLLVDLLAHLRLDLARVAREEREEALLAGVDHVDIVEGNLR